MVVCFGGVEGYMRGVVLLLRCNNKRSYYPSSLGADDLMRVRAIFKWICTNIRFDTEAFWAEKSSYTKPKDVLKHKLATAKGYAELFTSLCEEAGIEVYGTNTSN